MAIADSSGLVMIMVGFFTPPPGPGTTAAVGFGTASALGSQPPNTPSVDTFRQYKAPVTATVGALADAVAVDQGYALGTTSLMMLPRAGVLPVLEARATLLSNSVIPYGARCVCAPSS